MTPLLLLVVALAPGGDTLTPPPVQDTLAVPLVAAPADTLDPPPAEPKPPARDYAACVAAVDEGKTVTLCVGVTASDAADFYVRELRDDKGTPFAPGRYLCRLENGVRRMQLKDPPAR